MDEVLASTLRLSIPIIFAAYGGLFSERSGIANIALESYLLVSAFFGAAVAYWTKNAYVGLAAGMMASMLMGFVMASICVFGKSDQIVAGMGMNFIAMGMLPFLSKVFFGVTGSTPGLDLSVRFVSSTPFFLAALFLLAVLHFLFFKTAFGIRVEAAGENPSTLLSQGISPDWTRMKSVVMGAAIAGVGGVYLSLCQGSGFVRDMAAGRGFIALTAIIFGRWKPIPAVVGCLLFGFLDSVQIRLQGVNDAIPTQFIQIIPYVATLLLLYFVGTGVHAPKALNRE